MLEVGIIFFIVGGDYFIMFLSVSVVVGYFLDILVFVLYLDVYYCGECDKDYFYFDE